MSKSKIKKSGAPKKPTSSAKKLLVKKGGATAILKKSADVLSRKNPDGTVSLLNLQVDSHFYQIDGLAAEIWLLIDGRKTIAAIKSVITKRHKVPEPRFSKDVDSLVKTLTKNKLVDSL